MASTLGIISRSAMNFARRGSLMKLRGRLCGNHCFAFIINPSPNHHHHHGCISLFSTSSYMDNPGDFVSGITKEDIENNPQLKEFLDANFSNQTDDDLTIPREYWDDFGLTEDDFNNNDTNTSDSSPMLRKPDGGLGNDTQQALNIRIMKTFIRTNQGSNVSRKLRDEQKLIPGIIHGSDPNRGILSNDPTSKILIQTPWPELQREMARYRHSVESRVYDLKIYNNNNEEEEEVMVERVVPRSIHKHPVKESVYCANFVRYHPGRPIKLPIVYINQDESPALKRDGFIIPINKYIECIIEDGVPIPEKLELECTGIKYKEVIRVDRIIFPDGVKISKNVDVSKFIVGPVHGSKVGAAKDDDNDENEK